MTTKQESLHGIPAEWEQQSALLITWPHEKTAWPSDVFHEVENTLKKIIGLTAPHQTIIIVCHTAELIGYLAIELGQILGDLRFVHAPSNDIWARDHGPISCKRDNDTVFLDFQFNGWGGKYPYQHDNRITPNLDEQCVFQSNVIHQNYILEGGSIESDGNGTLLTTTDCLLNSTRNPDYNRSEIEDFLKKHTGTQRLLWLEHGYLSGDDTDSHIDNLARFISPDTIVFSACNEPQDEHYIPLQKMKLELENFTDNCGEKYKLVPAPIPKAIYNQASERLPASYCNFLITNTHVFVPQFNDENDVNIIEIMSHHYPEKSVVGVDSIGIIHQYGGIHCATMNLFGKIAM